MPHCRDPEAGLSRKDRMVGSPSSEQQHVYLQEDRSQQLCKSSSRTASSFVA